ncbi:MAG: purine-nucleoside phosphorylase [Caldithrix sp.]|nr:purine-nucleoside phosphorylase [Caldithrix sp.]
MAANRTQVNRAVEFIRTKTQLEPRAGIILGSGLGTFADELSDKVKIATSSIPEYPESTVSGHKGYLVFGYHKTVPVLAVQGRTHFYEGYPIQKVSFVVRLMEALGIRLLVVTNAAGGVNSTFEPGDLMLITDHVNFLFQNPLIGPVENDGPRFPDMSDAYTCKFFDRLEHIALEEGIKLKKGVLWASGGPTYETRAEVQMAKRFGADAASMSTVPEVITAVQSGMQVIGISCITNLATGISSEKLSHDEVKETADRVRSKFTRFVKAIIEKLIAAEIK